MQLWSEVSRPRIMGMNTVFSCFMHRDKRHSMTDVHLPPLINTWLFVLNAHS